MDKNLQSQLLDVPIAKKIKSISKIEQLSNQVQKQRLK